MADTKEWRNRGWGEKKNVSPSPERRREKKKEEREITRNFPTRSIGLYQRILFHNTSVIRLITRNVAL